MTKKILNEIRDELIAMGLAQNEPEFCVAWLGRGIGYMRTLRHLSQEPSAEALAILAALAMHAIGYVACLREPRVFDLWITKVSRCPRVRNWQRWGCNSYAP